MCGLALHLGQMGLWNFKTELILPKAYVCEMSTIWDYVRAMFGPFGDPVLPCFTSASVWALKFARLTQHGIRRISMNHLLFETMSGLLDHFGAMLGLPRDWRFSRLSQHGQRKILWGVYFLHHVRAMFKPCLNSVWPCFSSMVWHGVSTF